MALVGATLLTALLFALHRLRMRRQIVRVPTAMFWRVAAQDAPARMLHERFRHWLTFLLALAIVLLLWFAAAGPRLDGVASDREEAFYLDASAIMTVPGAFDAAVHALTMDVDKVPAARRSVWLGGVNNALLLAPGENKALLPARLAGVKAAAFPSRFVQWLGRRGAPAPALVRYYGFAEGWRAARAAVPRGTVVEAGYLAESVRGNRGIVALGASPAASGAWDRADILVETAANDGPPPAAEELAFQRDSRPFSPTIVAHGPGRYLLRDVPADGQRLSVSLRRGDGFAADDVAALRLPLRPRIRVALLPGVPAGIRAVIDADPALAVSAPGQADVVVRDGADRLATDGRPTLLLAHAADGAQTLSFTMPATDSANDSDRQRLLAATIDQLGFARFDAPDLAERLGRPISVGLADGPVRQVAVWKELFAQPGFARSSLMPLFLSQALRWLAAPRPWLPYASAGGTLVDLDRMDGLTESPALAALRLGGSIALPAAGDSRVGDVPIITSLTDRATTSAVGVARPDSVDAAGAHILDDLDLPFLSLVLAALLLLAAEWIVFQRGWMP